MEAEEKNDDLGLDDTDNEGQDFEDDFNYDNSFDAGFDAGGPGPLEKHNDLLKELTNFDPYLKASFNNWLGLSWDEEEQKFKRNPLIRPVMSLNCATWCTGLQKTYARGNNIITDISSQEYKHMVSDIIDAIWLNLGTRDDFEVFENGDLIRIANELQHSAELALMGAGDGKYNKFLGTTITRSESVTNNNNPQHNMELHNRRQPSPSKLDRLRKTLLGE